MPAEQAQEHSTLGENPFLIATQITLAVVILTLVMSVNMILTLGAFLTCMGMFGSGRMTGIVLIRQLQQLILLVLNLVFSK